MQKLDMAEERDFKMLCTVSLLATLFQKIK